MERDEATRGFGELRQIAIGIAPENDRSFVTTNCGRAISLPIGDESQCEMGAPVAGVVLAHLIRQLPGEGPIVSFSNGACGGFEVEQRLAPRVRARPCAKVSHCLTDHRPSSFAVAAFQEELALDEPEVGREHGSGGSGGSKFEQRRVSLAARAGRAPGGQVRLLSAEVTGGAQPR